MRGWDGRRGVVLAALVGGVPCTRRRPAVRM
jgi:hypothetical protein